MKKIFTNACFAIIATTLFAQNPGYYNGTEKKTGDELKAVLHNIINGHVDFSYSDAKYILNYADEDPNNTNNLIQLYTNRSVSKDDWGTGGDKTNREHVWAKSHGSFEDVRPMDGDAHNLHAADGSVNVLRSNYDFDYVTGGTYISEADAYYTDGTFEPADRDKGVIARTLLYMAVRYEGTNEELDLEVVDEINTSPKPEHGRLSTLLEWNRNFPPTEMEKRRNERVFQSQLNRNPFIDNPQFADVIWGSAQVSGTTISAMEIEPKNPKAGESAVISATFANNDISATATLYWGKTFNSETYSSVYTGTGDLSAPIDLSDFSDNELVYVKTVTSDGVVKHNSFYAAPDKTLTDISDVQGTGNASPIQNQTVTVSGIVTANLDNSFYIQSGNEKYSGLCIYSNWRGKIGDSVAVTGKVVEYQNLTELSDVSMVHNYGFKDTANPVTLNIAELSEDYEGMFVEFEDVVFSNPDVTIPGDGGTYSISQGNESATVYIRYNSRLVGKSFPKGLLKVKAIVSQYGSSHQLLIDNMSWIDYTKETEAPVANEDIVSTDVNTTVQISPLENDVYNPGISFTIHKNGSNGSAEIPFTNPTSINYTPNNNFEGIDTVQYKIAYSAQPDLFAIGNIVITVGSSSINDINVPLFKIYPNPSDGIFNILVNEPNEDSRILISDISGKIVKQINTTEKELRINLTDFESGYYLVHMNSSGKTLTKKIIIK